MPGEAILYRTLNWGCEDMNEMAEVKLSFLRLVGFEYGFIYLSTCCFLTFNFNGTSDTMSSTIHFHHMFVTRRFSKIDTLEK